MKRAFPVDSCPFGTGMSNPRLASQIQPAETCHVACRSLQRSRNLTAGELIAICLLPNFQTLGNPCRLDNAALHIRSCQCRAGSRWSSSRRPIWDWASVWLDPGVQDEVHGMALYANPAQYLAYRPTPCHSSGLQEQKVGHHCSSIF